MATSSWQNLKTCWPMVLSCSPEGKVQGHMKVKGGWNYTPNPKQYTCKFSCGGYTVLGQVPSTSSYKFLHEKIYILGLVISVIKLLRRPLCLCKIKRTIGWSQFLWWVLYDFVKVHQVTLQTKYITSRPLSFIRGNVWHFSI